ncbi:hypothetical protein [Streptomyces sp. NPDC057428]|uniref:hypothetical protein n=1 Tax=Streptomyces sp. NPDC057428 TaxID=3346129 RepID=UPI0036C454A5
MSMGIVVTCDRSVPYGICAARLYTGARTEAEAYEVAARAGWSTAGAGSDRCPAHTLPRPRRSGPPCGNNPRARATSADWQVVTDFLTYLKNRKETPTP